MIAAFGAGVNEWEPCKTLTERGDFDIFLLAGRHTLLENEALAEFLPLAQARGIGLVMGAPYNSGILAPRPLPRRDVLLRARSAAGAGPRRAHQGDLRGTWRASGCGGLPVRAAPPTVVSVIPGMATPAEVAGNVMAAEALVPNDLWADLKAQG